MKVSELIALLSKCDQSLEVAAGWPIVAQPSGKDHQKSMCYIDGVDEANLEHETAMGKRFVLIQIRGVDDVLMA
jgi:hypothetical protein